MTEKPSTLKIVAPGDQPKRTRRQRLRSWRPSTREWLLLVPAMVWTLALLVIFTTTPVLATVAALTAFVTSCLLGVLCSRYHDQMAVRDAERKELQDMLGVAMGRLDRLEHRLGHVAQ